MVNIGFLTFVYLAVISIVVSLILIKVKIPGGYITKLILGYLGAWVGTPVFGKWEFLTLNNISIIPAVIGAFAAILLGKAIAECGKK
jgi:uncharacterized membrane protein YeaQ/YmgE (transglycosylase-associated protein family)